MKLRLTKTNAIVFSLVILILSGALIYLIWRVNQESTVAPTDTDAAVECNPPCGNKPDLAGWGKKYNQSIKNMSDSSKGDQDAGYSIPSKIVIPAGTKGEIMLYYKSLEGSMQASFELNDQPFNATNLDSNKRQIIATGIQVSGGETFNINSQVLNGSESFAEGCAGSNWNKYWSLGWIEPSGGKCGTTFGGPPQGRQCEPFKPASVSTEISWVETIGDIIISQQCWGDWMEWKGDYDFDDYFLIVAVKEDTPEPEAKCGDGILGNTPGEQCEKDNPTGVACTWDSCNQTTCKCLEAGLNITKGVVESCKDEGTENPTSQLTYTVTVTNSGDGKGQVRKIEDALDSKVVSAGLIPTSITPPGVYSNGKIVWDFSSPESTSGLIIEAGQEKIFIYKLDIAKSHFGTYNNTVTLTPVSGDTITANATIEADCEIVLPPGFSITKEVVKSCRDEDSENPTSQLSYTITVKNSGQGSGQISRIEDALDSKVVSAGLVPTSITSPGAYSNGKIEWSFSPAITVGAGESKIYTYSLDVGKSHFGTYDNKVTLIPTTGDAITADATVEADCKFTTPPPVTPQTGLFDTTLGRIVAGLLLIALGYIVYNIPSGVFSFDWIGRNSHYRTKFENKIKDK